MFWTVLETVLIALALVVTGYLFYRVGYHEGYAAKWLETEREKAEEDLKDALANLDTTIQQLALKRKQRKEEDNG